MPSMFMSSARRRRRRWPLYVALALLVVGGGLAGAYFAFWQKPGNTFNKSAPFQTTAPPP